MKVLVFDTETSGLPPQEAMNNYSLKYKLLSFNEEKWSNYLESWPELLQLTYFIYDDETGEVEKIYDNYVEISAETKQKMEETIHDLRSKGKDSSANVLQGNLDRLAASHKKNICDVVCEFLNDVEHCDVVVGHNINFDILMMISSAKKALFDENCREINCKNLDRLIELLNRDNLNKVCTMKDGTQVCEIPKKDYKTGEIKTKMVDIINEQGEKVKVESVILKPPKLIELFNKLFDTNIDESKLHDSKYDVLITLLVYLKLKEPSFALPDVSEINTENPVMQEYYNLIKTITTMKSDTMKTGGKKTRKKKTRKLRKTKKLRKVKKSMKKRMKKRRKTKNKK
jgi:DNA polymerase III epsilon subunit-like protein